MKKNIALYSAVVYVICCMLFSCASAPESQSERVSEQELFSSPAYIAARGYGQNGQEAEENALVALSLYFSSHVTVETVQKTVSTDTSSHTRIDDATRVLSDTELIAVHYTKPSLNAKTQQYETIAYINRAEAKQMYEPKINAALQPFSAFYMQAEKETDVFKSTLLYLQAKNVMQDNAALNVLQFLHVLSPEDAETYSDIEYRMNTLDATIKETQAKCTVAVSLNGSDMSQVKGTTEEIISQLGLPLVPESLNAAYLCAVDVEEHKSILPAGVFFTPTVDISIVSQKSGESVFAYKKNLSRIGASTEQIARQKMIHAVTSELKQSLPPALKQSADTNK